MHGIHPTTAELITLFLLEARRRHAANTVRNRHPLLLRLARAHNGDLLDLTGDDIDRWLDRTQVTRSTRNAYLGALSGFYRWAVRKGYLEHNPCDDVIRVRTPRGLPRPIRPSDLDKALQLAEPRMRAWLSLMAFAGLRCCEVASVQADDLLWHLDPPMIHVRPHGDAGGPKGGNERLVPLAETAEQALIEYGLPRAGPIFRRPGTAEPVTPGHVSKTTGRYLDSIGVRATAHQLRHSFGTVVYEQTLDLRAVQELMGHSSPDTTAIYARFSRNEASAVVRRLGVTSPGCRPD